MACCLIMLLFGHVMERPAIVYPFAAVAGASALAWPLFTVWTLRAAIASLRNRDAC